MHAAPSTKALAAKAKRNQLSLFSLHRLHKQRGREFIKFGLKRGGAPWARICCTSRPEICTSSSAWHFPPGPHRKHLSFEEKSDEISICLVYLRLGGSAMAASHCPKCAGRPCDPPASELRSAIFGARLFQLHVLRCKDLIDTLRRSKRTIRRGSKRLKEARILKNPSSIALPVDQLELQLVRLQMLRLNQQMKPQSPPVTRP